MKLSMMMHATKNEAQRALAIQMGINYAITKAAPELTGKLPPYDFSTLKSIKENFEKDGIKLIGLEGDQFDMSNIKLGLEGRDVDIERYKQMLYNMGELGINLLCLNFMVSIGWFRSSTQTLTRGGALTTSFNSDDMSSETLENPTLIISEEKVRDNLYYFLDAVLPTAESCGVKMGLHPDDPPISPLCGIGRILKSASDYEKILSHYNSQNLGVTFCQATFKLMGEDLKKLSADWIKRDKIFFIHIRDVVGNAHNFTETFIDENKGFVSDMLKHYRDCGFNGILRSDHAPAMFGETQNTFGGGVSVGYQMLGHIFSYGYIKACCDTLSINIE